MGDIILRTIAGIMYGLILIFFNLGMYKTLTNDRKYGIKYTPKKAILLFIFGIVIDIIGIIAIVCAIIGA